MLIVHCSGNYLRNKPLTANQRMQSSRYSHTRKQDVDFQVTITEILIALVLFQVKHLIADFVLQTPYQLANKGRYGHPGGILHSGIQVGGTLAVLLWAGLLWLTIATVLVVEFLIHYHLDWAKEKLGQIFALDTSKAPYWWLFGVDQTLHQLTYVGILWWWFA